jgi:hypothetical protein
MGTPPDRHAFVIHGLDHARAALAAAAAAGRRPVALWSAPGAAGFMGAPMFREIVNAASGEFPDVDAVGVLDCGGDAGYALAALRHGIEALKVDLPPPTAAKIAAIAEGMGASIVGERPLALDLADCPEPVAACRAWLSAAGDPATPSCQPESRRVVEPSKDLATPENEK